MKLKRGIIALGLLSAVSLQSWAQQLKGVVIDKNSKETLIGAVISIEGTDVKAVTDVNGNFSFDGLKDGTYTLYIKYVGYKTLKIDGVQMKDANLTIALQPDEQQLKGVTVTAVERRNTDAAMIQVAKSSPVIVSNVSAQEISRTQDTNAGEVIRRVPGVSLIDDKFVMVRGLSQRYNNVWVNGGAVPSSEADSRAFSFDIIPSSQIDNLTIVKSPTAEYPADYSGGFIIVNTKEIPAENSFSLSVGGNWNTASAFQDFAYSKGSATDFLAFDNGMRSIHGGINASLAPQLDANGSPIDNYATSLLGNHLNNDWMVKSKKPLGDLKLAASLNHRWMLGGRTLGMLAALNYTNEYRTYEKMENNLFGIYDAANDKPNYLRHSVDDQYNNNVRLGAMLNFTLLSKDGNHKYQFKNIFNQLATSRYTWRDGVSAQSNLERSAEYYYRSRTTYNGQLTGKHTFTSDALDWSIGLIRGHQPCQLPQAPILHQHRVHAPGGCLSQDLRRLGQLPVGEQGVQGEIDLHSALVTVVHGPGKVLVRKISGAAAGVKAAQAHVYSVGPVLHGGQQGLIGPGGGEQLHSPHFLPCWALKSWRFRSEISPLAWAASSRYPFTWRRRFSAACSLLSSSSARFTAARTAASLRPTLAPAMTSPIFLSTRAATCSM